MDAPFSRSRGPRSSGAAREPRLSECMGASPVCQLSASRRRPAPEGRVSAARRRLASRSSDHGLTCHEQSGSIAALACRNATATRRKRGAHDDGAGEPSPARPARGAAPGTGRPHEMSALPARQPGRLAVAARDGSRSAPRARPPIPRRTGSATSAAPRSTPAALLLPAPRHGPTRPRTSPTRSSPRAALSPGQVPRSAGSPENAGITSRAKRRRDSRPPALLTRTYSAPTSRSVWSLAAISSGVP